MQYPSITIRHISAVVMSFGLLCSASGQAAALPPTVAQIPVENVRPFPAPPELQDAIGFWNALFLRYPQR